MMDLLRRWGHTRGTGVEAISGVDIALWDLTGRSCGRPIWSLLHGAGRTELPCYASSVYIADVDTMVQQALERVHEGFRAIKVKIGRSSDNAGIAADLEAVSEIRRAVGNDVDLMVDANGAYDAATAIRVARGLEKESIAWLEEPVPPDDREGYARVHAMTAVPIAAGETDSSMSCNQTRPGAAESPECGKSPRLHMRTTSPMRPTPASLEVSHNLRHYMRPLQHLL